MTVHALLLVHPAQGVGNLLRSSPHKEWEKLVQYCRESPSLQDETQWAVAQITHTLRS